MNPVIESQRPVVLIVGGFASLESRFLERHGYSVIEVSAGAHLPEWVRDCHPDIILLDECLPDMSGIEAAGLLHSDGQVDHRIPLLILASSVPTPEQRVTALGAGIWDFLTHPRGSKEFLLRLQTYVQAKRNIDSAVQEGLVDAATGLYSRWGLARRARELGALMTRHHGALACVVLTIDGPVSQAKAGSVLTRVARVSDVVGAQGDDEFTILAPSTDDKGAIQLAHRIAKAFRERFPEQTPALHAGYEAVSNLRYSPMDPADLLLRAATAVRTGRPEPGSPWVRRFAPDRSSNPELRVTATATGTTQQFERRGDV